MTWHVVSTDTGVIIGVYGSALLTDAQEKARSYERQTGLFAYVHSGTYKPRDRPCVGQTISMVGIKVRR